MRKFIVSMNLSLDGYLSGPRGELDWHFEIWDQQMGDKLLETLAQADTIILGRITYEAMAKFWTTKPMEADFPRQDLAIADKMNQHTKVVFSRTMKKSIWRESVFVTGDPNEEIKRLKMQTGKDMILYGSAGLTSTLNIPAIVDEYHLWIHPVILGQGNPFFCYLQQPVNLVLKESVRFDSGVVANYYSTKSKLPPDSRGQWLRG